MCHILNIFGSIDIGPVGHNSWKSTTTGSGSAYNTESSMSVLKSFKHLLTPMYETHFFLRIYNRSGLSLRKIPNS